MELDEKAARLQEMIRVRKFCYRMHLAMVWLLALACWVVVWYAAIPMMASFAFNAVLARRNHRVHRQLVHELAELRTKLLPAGVYR